MMTLTDGRSELWQWDTGRKMSVDADCTQVHFSNKVFGRSIDVDVVDGIAIIPDILLQTDKEMTAWAFVGTAENGYTKISKVFKVNKRNKPADYVFTAPDQTTLGGILDRIEELENRPSGDVSEEDIQNAVNDYLDKNPVSFVEKDPTVPAWAKQPNKPTYTAAEVGAMPADAGAENEQVLHDVTLTETVGRIDINLEQDVYKHYAVLFYPKGNTEYQSANSTVTCFQYFSFSKNRKAELSVNFGVVPRYGAVVFSFYSDFENLVFSDPSVSKYEFLSVDEDVIRTGSVVKFAITSALANSLSAGTRVVLKGWDKK